MRRKQAMVSGPLRSALAIVLLFPVLAFAEPDFPELTGRVVDNAALLDESQEAGLVARLETHEAETSNQLVVITLPSLQGYDISDFSNRLLRHWQIGQAELDNGVLLVVAPNERQVRIEVGYGLEGALTDATSGDIIRRQILPQFREDDYPTGINRGVKSILGAIKGEYEIDPASLERNAGTGNGKEPVKHFPLLFLAIIALFEILKKFGWHKLGNSAFPTAMFGIAATAMSGNLLTGFAVAGAVFLLFFFVILPRSGRSGGRGTRSGMQTGRHDDSSRYNHGSGGGGGSGFSGGGGSGGGGGASGGW